MMNRNGRLQDIARRAGAARPVRRRAEVRTADRRRIDSGTTRRTAEGRVPGRAAIQEGRDLHRHRPRASQGRRPGRRPAIGRGGHADRPNPGREIPVHSDRPCRAGPRQGGSRGRGAEARRNSQSRPAASSRTMRSRRPGAMRATPRVPGRPFSPPSMRCRSVSPRWTQPPPTRNRPVMEREIGCWPASGDFGRNSVTSSRPSQPSAA